MVRILIILIITTLGSAAAAQNLTTKSKKAAKLYWEADAFMQLRQFERAIPILREAIAKDDEFAEAHYRLGYCLKTLRNYDDALPHLERARDLNPPRTILVNSWFHLGEAYFKFERYAESTEYLRKFLATKPTGYNLRIASELVKDSEFAQEKIKEQVAFNPRALGTTVNSFRLQYFPVLTVDQNTLIYTRRRGSTPQYDEDIVYTTKDENGKWTTPQPLSPKINTRYNEGTCAISADGRILIFTSCQGRRNLGSCDLFITYKEGDGWSVPENMGPNINSRAWESQPALSADGRTLYFVSDREGGLGARDIWVSTLDSEENWTRPVNLGPRINSARDEVSPFIHANGQTLYFASNSRRGFGGYDLFYSEIGEKGWSFPENLGYPINNSDDQVSLFITADGRKGYYSDEQVTEGFRMRSILVQFDIPEEIKVSHVTNYVSGRVFDAETKQQLKATVELFDLRTDSLKSLVQSDAVTGQYLMVLTEGSEYALYVNKPQYLFESLTFDYQHDENQDPINIDIYLRPIKSGSKTVLNNIFFEFDQYELVEKSETELHKIVTFLNNNPTVNVEIEGHTDNKGSAEYNQDLSLKRARSVHQYMVDAGIDPSRISFQGYGQTQPIAPNDTESNRALNRRIEFRIQ